jgi:hypothetical protein
MFHVDWLQSALDQLTAVWTSADSELRKAITMTVTRVEQDLKWGPEDCGGLRRIAQRERTRLFCRAVGSSIHG